MADLQNHQKTAAFYGFTNSLLTGENLEAIVYAGLDENAAYGIECDLQCGAFDTFAEALEWYKVRALED